ncbi:hypothetical protein QUB37_19875 [Microcoleus sp. AT3-A2]
MARTTFEIRLSISNLKSQIARVVGFPITERSNPQIYLWSQSPI